MATSSEDNNWLWNYYTLDNNIAKCNNCCIFYEMNRIQETNIMRHIKSKHGDEYQNIVSLQGSQEVCESQFYITRNNEIKCNYCTKTYVAINKWWDLKKHLKKFHKVEEDTAKALWLHRTGYNFDESDMNARQRCNDYNNTVPNELPLSLNRSSKVQVDVPLKTRPKKFLISNNWIWEYFTKVKESANCSVCNKKYVHRLNVSVMICHIKKVHRNIIDVSKNSRKAQEKLKKQGKKIWPYSVVENKQIKCDICDKTYDVILQYSSCVKKHLVKTHNLNEDIARNLCTWVLGHFYKSNLQTLECTVCENIFQNTNSFNLLIHLKEAHDFPISPKIIPAGLSSKLSSLFNSNTYAQHNATCSYQQPTSSLDQSSNFDNVNNQIDLSSESDRSSETGRTGSTSSSCSLLNSDTDEDTAISSSYQQPTFSFDQRSNIDDVNNQIKVFSETRPMGLSSSSRIVLISVDCLRKYFIPEEVDEKCFICDNNYILQKTYSSMEGHINKKDSQQNVSLENSQVLYKLFPTIADEQTKGAICDVQTSRCMICGIIFIKCNSFTLRKHLLEVHPLEISSEINPMRDAVDITTTSSFSESIYSSNLADIKDFNVDFDHNRAENIGEDGNLMLPPDEFFIDVT